MAAFLIAAIPLFSSTARADEPWVEERSEHFVFRYHPAQRKIARDVIGRAERERDRIVADLGRGGDVVVEVRLAYGPADFQQAQPEGQGAPIWSTGLAYPTMKLIVLQLRGGAGGGPEALDRTFVHELSHLMLFQAVGGRRVPRWLNEGMAMYHAGEWQFGRAMTITRAIAFGTVIRIRDLDRSLPDRAPEVHLAYAESIEFVSYLFGRYGREGMSALIGRLAGGESIDAAARAAFGAPLDDVEARWLGRLRWYYAWIPIISSSATLWFVITLVFLAGYARRRAQNRRRLRAMEEEELVLSALGRDQTAGPTRITKKKGEGGGDEVVTWTGPGDRWVH